MDHYIEAKLLPDPEFSAPLLMSALCNKLHRALVATGTNNVGISFPDYRLTPKALGSRLRVHGSQAALLALLESGWLKGMTDHVVPVNVLPVPAVTQYLLVQRKQYKTNAERLRRRRMERKGESYEQVCQAIPDRLSTVVNSPFVNLRSQSTGQTFSLFIDQRSAATGVDGSFNSYGLSNGGTVPSF